jgi:purine-binding chemotaxis protein CheW
MLDELIKSGQKEIQIIIFKLGSEEYAVPINNVQEIVMPQKATRIPKSPDYVQGFINLRGNIIPVVDGKRKFSLDDGLTHKDNRIMILEVGVETMGLYVDCVNEVITLSVNNIDPPPIEVDEGTDIFWGIGKYDGRLLILINAEKFMSVNNEEKDADTFAKVTEVIKLSQAIV